MVAQTRNPSTQDVETGGSVGSLLHSEFEASVNYMGPCLKTKQTKGGEPTTKSPWKFKSPGVSKQWYNALLTEDISLSKTVFSKIVYK